MATRQVSLTSPEKTDQKRHNKQTNWDNALPSGFPRFRIDNQIYAEVVEASDNVGSFEPLTQRVKLEMLTPAVRTTAPYMPPQETQCDNFW